MGEAPPKGFDRAIADYYEQAPEETRLEQGPFQLEEARTRDLIQRTPRRRLRPSRTSVEQREPTPSGWPRPAMRST